MAVELQSLEVVQSRHLKLFDGAVLRKNAVTIIGKSLLLVLTLVISASTSFAEEFSYEDLENLIKRHGIKSIADLNSRLPISYRSKNTFKYETGSLQKADELNPRAIVFGDMASLILAHNGNPNHSGYNSLEVMQWRPEKRALELRQIEFPEGRTGSVKFSEANPSGCVRCHGKDPVWKWDEAYTWDGTYGSSLDVLAAGEAQTENFLKFKESAASHARFRPLLVKSSNPMFPYASSQESRYSAETGMPNAGLSVQIAAMNGLRVARLVQNSSAFQDIRNLVLFSLIGCQHFLDQETRTETIGGWVKNLGGKGESDIDVLRELLLFRLLKLDRTDVYPNINSKLEQYRDGLENTVGRPSTVLDYAGAAIAFDLKNKKLFEGVTVPSVVSRKDFFSRKYATSNDFDLSKLPAVVSHLKAGDRVQQFLDLSTSDGKAFCKHLEAEANEEANRYEATLKKHQKNKGSEGDPH